MNEDGADTFLRVFLLGTVEFEAARSLQRALAYEVAGDRRGGALILCEHPPLITVGREGSVSAIACGPDELRARRWAVRWVGRGGGCWLHQPGQLAVYPVLPLDRLGLGLRDYLDRFQDVFVRLLDDFRIAGKTREGEAGVWANGRPIAALGVAVQDWVAQHGAVLNVCPDLTPYKLVRTALGDEPMTSLERERRGPLSPSLARQRLVEHFSAVFPAERVSLFHGHPLLTGRAIPSRRSDIPA